MVTPAIAVTRQNMRRELARYYNDLVFFGYLGSIAASTNQINAQELNFTNAQVAVGKELSLVSGGGADIANNSRIISAATAYTTSVGGIVQVIPSWPSLPSINSGWEIHDKFLRQDYEDVIDQAIRSVQDRILIPQEEYLIARSGIRNGAFDRWSAGTSLAPDEFTLDGNSTISREATIVQGSRFSAAVVTDGTNLGSLTQTVRDIGRWAGKAVTLRALVYTTTSGRVFIRLNDGSTDFDSDNHAGASGGDGDGQWRVLEVSTTLGTAITTLTGALRVSAGGAVTAYISKLWIEGVDFWQLPLEFNWAWIQDMFEQDAAGDWTKVPREHWYIEKDYESPRIAVIPDWYQPQVSKILRLVGQVYPTIPAETDNIPISAAYVRDRGIADLFTRLPWGAADWRGYQARAKEAQDRAALQEKRFRLRVLSGSKRVTDV